MSSHSGQRQFFDSEIDLLKMIFIPPSPQRICRRQLSRKLVSISCRPRSWEDFSHTVVLWTRRYWRFSTFVFLSPPPRSQHDNMTGSLFGLYAQKDQTCGKTRRHTTVAIFTESCFQRSLPEASGDEFTPKKELCSPSPVWQCQPQITPGQHEFLVVSLQQ